MKANFKIIKLTKYKNVGNAIGKDYHKYLAEKNAAETAVYGITGGTYYLPTFEVTLDNGIVGIYGNYYETEIIEEISPDGLDFKIADSDTLGYYGTEAKLVPFENLSITIELKEDYLNSAFGKHVSNILKGVETQWQEVQRYDIASQAVWAAGLRDCEIYVLPIKNNKHKKLMQRLYGKKRRKL
jgi:hypothetical protein